MEITSVRINEMENPIGFDFSKLRIGWVATQTDAASQVSAKIEVAEDADFTTMAVEKEGAELSSVSEELAVDLKPRTRYYVRVSVKADNGDEAISDGTAFFETAKMEEPWVGQWIKPQSGDDFHPVFVKTFNLKQVPTAARLYISGLGFYRVKVNGAVLGNEHLTPYFSDYPTEVQYQTYPIDHLAKGENIIEVSLGNGWYKGVYGLELTANNFGSEFMMIAELHLDFADGSHEVVASDDTWCYRGSDVESSGIYDGEVLDRLLWNDRLNPLKMPVVTSIEGALVERYSLPVTVHEELPVREIIHTPAGETVLDFGQNFAGIVRVHAHWPKGTRLVLDFGEILQGGNFYNDNYRTAKSQFVYISDGREEIVEPRFTFFGFRYVRVTGLDEVDAGDFTGCALYSNMKETGWLSTGNAKVNQLISNIKWGQRSNFIDFPTDCPQRDERLGWTGDAQVFSEAASYLRDTGAFFAKFLHDVRVVQEKQDGKVPAVIPIQKSFPMAAAVWGDVATFTPTVLYSHYGDKAALANTYQMMKDWVDYIDRNDRAHNRSHLFDFDFQLADWVALDGRTDQSYIGGTDGTYVASLYYAMSTAKLADAAEILGYPEDAKHYHALYDEIRDAILKNYYTPTGRLAVDTQTGYVLALYSGIYPDKDQVVEAFRTRLLKDNYQIKGGFAGAPIMCQVMAENGLEAEALYFLTQEDFPGWLHEVNLGATTVWERWNSVLDDGSISGTGMNSLNHFAFGSVAAYLFRDIAGLQPLEPGFTKALIKSQINYKLSPVAMKYESVAGTWEVEWEVKDGQAQVRIQVPFNCTAQVDLPDYPEGAHEVKAGTHEYTYAVSGGLFTKYGFRTHYEELVDDPEAMAIIAKYAPALASVLEGRDKELMKDTLESSANLFQYGVDSSIAEAMAQDLMKL